MVWQYNSLLRQGALTNNFISCVQSHVYFTSRREGGCQSSKGYQRSSISFYLPGIMTKYKNQENSKFLMIEPTLSDQNKSFWWKNQAQYFFDKMRLERSLRPLRLLRLLRSLRPLRFLMPGNHSVCKVQAQDSQTTFKPNLTCIFLSARARYFVSNPNGGPCRLHATLILNLVKSLV